jgi:hypothetical protein
LTWPQLGEFEVATGAIVNEPSKLLISKALAAASQILTVTITVNLSRTSIGAGFRRFGQS